MEAFGFWGRRQLFREHLAFLLIFGVTRHLVVWLSWVWMSVEAALGRQKLWFAVLSLSIQVKDDPGDSRSR